MKYRKVLKAEIWECIGRVYPAIDFAASLRTLRKYFRLEIFLEGLELNRFLVCRLGSLINR
jgi:hypothetical protein